MKDLKTMVDMADSHFSAYAYHTKRYVKDMKTDVQSRGWRSGKSQNQRAAAAAHEKIGDQEELVKGNRNTRTTDEDHLF